MSSDHTSFSKKNITRAGIGGAILGVSGVGMFLLLWMVTDNLGFDTFTRLVLSICLPPTGIALLLGVFILVKRPAHK